MRFICENCGKETRENMRELYINGKGWDYSSRRHFNFCSEECQTDFFNKMVAHAKELSDSAANKVKA